MTRAERFFYFHADWGYDPAIETLDEGRRRGARELATAEQAAQDRWEYEWQDECEEWDGDAPAPRYLLWCRLYDPQRPRVTLASLGMIGLNDLNDPYRRVVEAELALEALGEISKQAMPALRAACLVHP